MSFLVDTDICSAYLNQAPVVFNRFMQYTGRIYLSAVSLGELATWAFRRRASPRRLQGVRDLLNDSILLEVDQDVAWKSGEIRAHLFDLGLPTQDSDLLIAATALVHGLTLVTHNTQDFTNVPGLAMVDWLVP